MLYAWILQMLLESVSSSDLTRSIGTRHCPNTLIWPRRRCTVLIRFVSFIWVVFSQWMEWNVLLCSHEPLVLRNMSSYVRVDDDKCRKREKMGADVSLTGSIKGSESNKQTWWITWTLIGHSILQYFTHPAAPPPLYWTTSHLAKALFSSHLTHRWFKLSTAAEQWLF